VDGLADGEHAGCVATRWRAHSRGTGRAPFAFTDCASKHTTQAAATATERRVGTDCVAGGAECVCGECAVHLVGATARGGHGTGLDDLWIGEVTSARHSLPLFLSFSRFGLRLGAVQQVSTPNTLPPRRY
jgi:hypothetical protein